MRRSSAHLGALANSRNSTWPSRLYFARAYTGGRSALE